MSVLGNLRYTPTPMAKRRFEVKGPQGRNDRSGWTVLEDLGNLQWGTFKDLDEATARALGDWLAAQGATVTVTPAWPGPAPGHAAACDVNTGGACSGLPGCLQDGS